MPWPLDTVTLSRPLHFSLNLSVAMTPVECCKAIDEHLNKSHQIWLMGAGISKESGIPLMHPLTDRVQASLVEPDRTTFQTLRALLDPKAHVEMVLTHVVNLIAVAEVTVNKDVAVGDALKTADELRALHRKIQEAIKQVIRWGYVAAEGGGAPERIGTPSEPIVSVERHDAFARAFFGVRRRHQDSFAPVAFFTTNYDTLLEDALALTRVQYLDGFNGGSLAFLESQPSSGRLSGSPLSAPRRRARQDLQAPRLDRLV